MSSETQGTSERRAIVVLGIRSGTSAIARVLMLLGAGGPRHPLPPSPSNPAGHWEPEPIVELNGEILASMSSRWDAVSALSPDRLETAASERFGDRATTLLEEEFGDSSLFVLKDPRISRMLPFWIPVLERAGVKPGFMIAVRSPLEVAASLEARDGMPATRGLLVWLRYALDAELESRGRDRAFLSYERLLGDWRTAVETAGDRLGVRFPEIAGATAEVERFLDPSHRHQAASREELGSLDDAPEWAGIAFAELARAASTGEEPDPRSMDLVREQLLQADRAHGVLLTDAEREIARLAEAIAEQHKAAEALRRRHLADHEEYGRQRKEYERQRKEYERQRQEYQRQRGEFEEELEGLKTQLLSARLENKRQYEHSLELVNWATHLQRSRSWRLTSPLRRAATALRWLLRRRPVGEAPPPLAPRPALAAGAGAAGPAAGNGLQEPPPDAVHLYPLWTELTRVGALDMFRMRDEASGFAYRPLISVLMPVRDPEKGWLQAALDSVVGQTYAEWELCICNDGSVEPHVREVLDLYERLDPRIKVRHREEGAGIASATNEALSISTGEFVTPMDHDDTLAPDALFEVAKFLQEHQEADLVYTDEDKVDEQGQHIHPLFKPGWSPDMALCTNYLVHLSVYRRTLLEQVGAWREGYDGAQDFDLMLRFTEATAEIHRLPRILYHWHAVEGSVALHTKYKPYTHERARRVVADALERRGIEGDVLDGFVPNAFRVKRRIQGRPRVAVLIPFAGRERSARQIKSLASTNTHPDTELFLLARSRSRRAAAAASEGASVLTVDGATPLEIYGEAIERISAAHVLLLGEGVGASSTGWLEPLLEHAQRPEVGVAGGKLISPEGHIAQAGLVLKPEAREGSGQRFYYPFSRDHPGFRIFVDLTRNCSALPRACMMFRRETFEEVGGFDLEHFDDTFGDIDLCLRLRERGYLHVYTPYSAFVQEDVDPALGLNSEQVDYVLRRWGDVIEDDPYDNPNLKWSASDLPSALSLIGIQ